jgi:hypothetical protein
LRLVAKQHVGHFELVGHQRLDSDVSFILVIGTPDAEDWDWMWEGRPLYKESVTLRPAAIASLGPLRFSIDTAQGHGDSGHRQKREGREIPFLATLLRML